MNLGSVDSFVFDFDGVLTDNRVYVDQEGREAVCCNRSDGLGFDALKKLGKSVCIISTEINPVVIKRAQKLGVTVSQGVKDKSTELIAWSSTNNFGLERTIFVGNDLNDYGAMSICGYSACPSDSHAAIRSMASFVLKTKGGDGVVRELLEDVFKVNLVKVLYAIGDE